MTMRQLAKSRDARVYLIGQSFSLFGIGKQSDRLSYC